MATRAAQESEIVTAAQALAFVERHGIVCESARRGGVPSLVDAIAGAPVHGNWWSHARGKTIFALTRAVRATPHVLVCRLVDGKVTLAHERVWPALVRLADRFPRAHLARIHEVHAASGKHALQATEFPDWLPRATAERAEKMPEADAERELAAVLHT